MNLDYAVERIAEITGRPLSAEQRAAVRDVLIDFRAGVRDALNAEHAETLDRLQQQINYLTTP